MARPGSSGPQGADRPEFDAERRLRREADARVLAHLVATGYDPRSDEWARVRDALAEYGFAVLRIWLRNGTARRRAAQYGVMGAAAIGPRYSNEDADAIAADVTIEGVDRFRESVLARGLWDLDGGAALSTFFVRFLLMRLPNECRKRRRGSQDEAHLPLDETLEDPPSEEPTAERRTMAEAELAEATALIGDPDLVDVFRLIDSGFTYVEIGSMLDCSVGSLKAKVMRARRLARSAKEVDP